MKFLLVKQSFIYFITAIFIVAFAPCYAQDLKSAEYPIFKELNPKSQVVGILDTKHGFKIVETRDNAFLDQPAAYVNSNPLKYYRDCIFVSQNEKKGWIIDGITIKERKYLLVDFKQNLKVLPSLIFTIALILVFLTLLILKYSKTRNWKLFITDKYNVTLLVLFLIIFRIALILNVMFQAGTFFVGTDDAAGYYQTGQAIFSTWDFTQCRYLVGHSFFVGLFSFIFGIKTWQEMVIPFSYFSALFIGSVCCILIYLLTNMLFRSKNAGLISLTIFVIYPFIVQVYHTEIIFTRDLLALPSMSEYSSMLYYWSSLVGYNALSDMSNMCFILGLFSLALWLYPLQDFGNRRNYMYNYPLLLGIIFGFSGSIRPSNIYFLPFIMYIVMQNTVTWKNIKYWQVINKLCFLAIGTIIGFSPQILANYLQDGNIFTLPYHIFHSEELRKGFEVSFLNTGGGIIFNAFSMLFSLALAGFFITRQEVKVFAAFWIIPILFFYCGYFGVSDAVRFILPIIPIMMILAQQALRKYPVSCLVALLIIFCLTSRHFVSIQTEFKHVAALAVCIVISGIFYLKTATKNSANSGGWKQKKKTLIFIIILCSQMMIIMSSLPYGKYSFLFYFAIMVAGCFIQTPITQEDKDKTDIIISPDLSVNKPVF